jgi:hypothetical protein
MKVEQGVYRSREIPIEPFGYDVEMLSLVLDD